MRVQKFRVVSLATAAIVVAAPLAGVAAAQSEKGAKVDAAATYKQRCAMCHGPNGDAKLPGMAFVNREWKHGSGLKEIAAVIRNGVPGTAMLAFKSKLNDAEIDAVAKYVRAFDPTLKTTDVK